MAEETEELEERKKRISEGFASIFGKKEGVKQESKIEAIQEGQKGKVKELQKEKDGDKSENQDAQATEGRPVAVRSQEKADPGAGQSARETGLKKGEGEDTLGTLVDIRV